MMVKEMFFGTGGGQITQEPSTREQTWDAILVTEDGGNGEFKFPWWLFGIAGAVIVGIRTKKVLDKERHS